MNEKKKSLINYFINLSFFLYFIILIVERVLSVTLSLVNKVNLYGTGFDGFTYTLVFTSILAFIIYLILKCRPHIKALFIKNDELDYFHLCIASGILLLSGMVHTQYTVPVIQFISYGILIIGILLKVILMHVNSSNKLLLWLSFSYLVCFSMAIPVMYHSYIEVSATFHVIEAFAIFFLVGVFTYLMLLLFANKEDLFIPWAIGIAFMFDVTLIIMRWNEEINVFVLIFISLSVILFTIGSYIKYIKKKEE
ncbi:MAG: hypothetical protein K5906_02655 [Bacilli bacterium]|nr:hypothetical protein [Bacilli bacterium]